MRVSTAAILLSSIAAQQVAATGYGGGWDKKAPSYGTPQNTNNECSDKQKGGYDWKDVNEGDFSGYDGFNFQKGGSGGKGWTCGKGLGSYGGKRDLTKRTLDTKCVRNTVSKSKPATFDCGSKAGFSISHMQVSTGYDTDMEFHYKMPDGSTCKQTHSCSTGGTMVENKQCGGAKSVEVHLGGKSEKECGFGIHSIGFDCQPGYGGKTSSASKPGYTPTPSKPAETPKTTSPGKPSESKPGYTPPSKPSTESKPGYTPSQPGYTPSKPAETPSKPAESSPSKPAESSPSKPAESSPSKPAETPKSSAPGYTPPGSPSSAVSSPSKPAESSPATSKPVESSPSKPAETPKSSAPGYTPPGSPSSGSPSSPASSKPAETPSSSAPGYTPPGSPSSGSPSSPATSKPAQSTPATSAPVSAPSSVVPSGTAPGTPPAGPSCPASVPRCINTWLEVKAECKDNTDYSCYCKNADFTKEVIDCVSAWSGEEVQAALTFLVGICAQYVPQNPGIITNCPGSVTLGNPPPTPTPSAPVPPVSAPVSGPATTVHPIGSITPAPSAPAVPVTTIVYSSTVTVPCSSAGTVIPGSSTVSIISTAVTIPQVVFTTASPAPGAPSASAPVQLIPGTPAPVPAVPTSSINTVVVAPSGNRTTATALPSQFTGAASLNNVGGAVSYTFMGALLAFFAL